MPGSYIHLWFCGADPSITHAWISFSDSLEDEDLVLMQKGEMGGGEILMEKCVVD